MAIDDKADYYDAGGVEVNEVIRAKLTPPQYEGWLLANCIKYSLRLNWKGQPQSDARKLAIYGDLLRDLIDDPHH